MPNGGDYGRPVVARSRPCHPRPLAAAAGHKTSALDVAPPWRPIMGFGKCLFASFQHSLDCLRGGRIGALKQMPVNVERNRCLAMRGGAAGNAVVPRWQRRLPPLRQFFCLVLASGVGLREIRHGSIMHAPCTDPRDYRARRCGCKPNADRMLASCQPVSCAACARPEPAANGWHPPLALNVVRLLSHSDPFPEEVHSDTRQAQR